MPAIVAASVSDDLRRGSREIVLEEQPGIAVVPVQRVGAVQVFAHVGNAIVVQVAVLRQRLGQLGRGEPEFEEFLFAEALDDVVAERVENRAVDILPRLKRGASAAEPFLFGGVQMPDLTRGGALGAVGIGMAHGAIDRAPGVCHDELLELRVGLRREASSPASQQRAAIGQMN